MREAAGIARKGTDFDKLMVLVVFRSREFHEQLKRFPLRSVYRVMHPDLGGYWQFFGRIDVGETFFFHAPIPRDTEREGFDFKRLLWQVAGFEFACDLDHVGFWDLRNAVAETYRAGRLFIAGDAAHSHPPYGGFGLNNGLEDAVNLGWKLEAVLQGWGGGDLLDSYSSERQPVFCDVAEDFIAARIAKDAAFLARYNPQHDRTEFEVAWAARESESGNRAQSYEPNYEGSPIVFGPPNGVSSAHGKHSTEARAGHHLTPRRLTSGRDVFEELGQAFTLLAFDASARDVKSIEQAAKSLAIPLKVTEDSYRDGREAYGHRLILVRPDQFIAWAGDAASDGLTLLGKATGRGRIPQA